MLIFVTVNFFSPLPQMRGHLCMTAMMSGEEAHK